MSFHTQLHILLDPIILDLGPLFFLSQTSVTDERAPFVGSLHMGLVQTPALRTSSDGVRPDEAWVGGERTV